MYGLKVSDPEISIQLFLFTTLLSEIMLTILNPEFVTLVITSTYDIFCTGVNEITSSFFEVIDEIIKHWIREAACSLFSALPTILSEVYCSIGLTFISSS